MSTAKNILSGWSNYFIGDKVILKVAKERAAICEACPEIREGMHAAILPDMQIKEIRGTYCGVCKCPLSAAVRSKDYECPKKYW